jgi:hypothetical protein
MGGSGKCTRCASSFTLVPADDQRVPELAAIAAAPVDSDVKPVKEAPKPVLMAEWDAEEIAAHAELMAQFDAEPTPVSEPTGISAVKESQAGAPSARPVRPEAERWLQAG